MINGIKSKYILQKVFDYLKKKIKYSLLKINKKLLNDLNIQIKDFQEYKPLKPFNEKYQLKIKDTDEKILNLANIPISLDNEGLKYLSQLEFTELEELNLSENKITNISPLLNMKLDKLETLILSCLEKVDSSYYKKSKQAENNKNIINEKLDVSILEKINLKNLKKLDLSRNEKINISSLANINFDELLELNLRGILTRYMNWKILILKIYYI